MSFEIKKPILMIPGPMDVPDEVLRRCGHQVFPHYDSPTLFPEFYHQLTEKTKVIFGLKEGYVFIPNGSGTVAVNMAIASLCTPDDNVLVIDNGTFGAYAEKNLNALGIPYTLVKGEWGKAIDSDLVHNAMKKKKHKFIYMTHNESSTTIVNPITPIRYLPATLYAQVVAESLEEEYDYAVIKIDEPELQGRYRFHFNVFTNGTVGEQVLFFGFPFGTTHLTSHVGYISSDFHDNRVHKFQIDGSINPGNSGGPLICISSEQAIGIVTRTQTGLEKDFDQLVEAIGRNVAVLENSRQSRARVSIAGIDPVAATQFTLNILAKLSFNLKRSANVGIGYAYSSEHILSTGLFSA